MSKDRRDMLGTEGFNQLTLGRNGYFLYNRNDLGVGRAFREYGEVSALKTEVFLQLCGPGQRVAEVGAGVGAHTVALAQHVGPQGRVFAYEPRRLAFQTLCANVALNSLSNVECFNAAVGEGAGVVSIPDWDGQSPPPSAGPAPGGTYGQRVPVLSLDETLTAPSLALLKLSASAVSAAVLRGARGVIAAHHPAIYCENSVPERSAEMVELLFGYGYRAWWHLPPRFNPNNYFENAHDQFDGSVSVNLLSIHSSIHVSMTGAQEVMAAGDQPKIQVVRG